MNKKTTMYSVNLKRVIILLFLVACIVEVGLLFIATLSKTKNKAIIYDDLSEISSTVAQQVTDGVIVYGSTVIEVIEKFQSLNLQIEVKTKLSKGKIYNFNRSENQKVDTYDIHTADKEPNYIYEKGVFFTTIKKGSGGEYMSIVFTQQ